MKRTKQPIYTGKWVFRIFNILKEQNAGVDFLVEACRPSRRSSGALFRRCRVGKILRHLCPRVDDPLRGAQANRGRQMNSDTRLAFNIQLDSLHSNVEWD